MIDLNDLWDSNKITDLFDFYDRINSLNDIRDFSNQRPTPNIKVHKILNDVNSDITVVIPTMDTNGKYSEDMISFFHPLDVVLVESSGKYFNYSRSLNAGIRIAQELGKEWIIISNDDMIPISPVSKLIEEVKQIKEIAFLVPTRIRNGKPYIQNLSFISPTKLYQFTE